MIESAESPFLSWAKRWQLMRQRKITIDFFIRVHILASTVIKGVDKNATFCYWMVCLVFRAFRRRRFRRFGN